MSSGSESDEDYVPEENPEEPEPVSGGESADEETDQQYETERKGQKRKTVIKTKGAKKRITGDGVITPEEESLDPSLDEDSLEPTPEKKDEVRNPEEDKKKEDDLWAKFLEGTDGKLKPDAKASSSSSATSEPVVNKQATTKTDVTKNGDEQAREKRIFEFAGETIVVENNTIKERIKTADCPATASKLDGPSQRPGLGGAGLAGILGQINKKNKLSTLEKSKLDWSTYKQEEGIEEEIQSHNKGKKGYLDRRDFLDRSDVRQYEIERDLRMNRRSNH